MSADQEIADDREAELRRQVATGDLEGATTAALGLYGREILEFLSALHRNPDDAAEVFSLFAEGLWRSLPRFAWQCSMRTWAYAIARRVSLYYRRQQQRRRQHMAPLQDSAVLSQLVEAIRSATLPHLRTENKDRITELRNALPEDDQMLLMLRVDRQLAWNELAQVMHEDSGEPLAGDALKRESARLRKRFQSVKDKLYDLARREGIIE